MPIGKNAIKRVSNNGYSKVASSAPDMENSTVSVAKKAEKVEKTEKKSAPVSNKTAEKKTAPKAKSAPKSKVETKSAPKAEKKAPAKIAKTTATPAPVLKNETKSDARVTDNGCVHVGREMPIYLL